MQLTEGINFHDRYKLQRLLGRGGFSEVWLAQDNRTNVLVAVKVYAPGQGLDEAGISIFSQEFSLVFDMNHTNLLHPTHFDVWEGMPYLILPYCKNGSAFQYITNGQSMPEEECWKLLHDTASGLAYLHEKQPPIIHQDIKPDNILINDEGNYMITDFGISARVRHTMHQANAKEQSSGTMAYMGPERFSANPKPIMASDIWSLGAMMYELMTNDAPFGNFGGGMQKGGAELPEIKQNYSQALKNIVYKCLGKETWDRPSARDIEEQAYNVIHGITVPSESVQPTPVPQSVPASDSPQPVQSETVEAEQKEEVPVNNNISTSVPPTDNWNPKMSEPLKKSFDLADFISTTKGKVALGIAAAVVIGIVCVFCIPSGSNTPEEPVAENQDSINAVEYVNTCLADCKVLEESIAAKWTSDDDLQNQEIDSLLILTWKKYSEGLERITEFPDAPIVESLHSGRNSTESKLGELSEHFAKQISIMEELEQTDIADAYRARDEKIKEVLNSK